MSSPHTSLSSAPSGEIDALLRAELSDPFQLLGPHRLERQGATSLSIRVFQPRAAEVSVLLDSASAPIPAVRARQEGFFEAQLPAAVADDGGGPAPRYRLRLKFHDGATADIEDPYRFPPQLTDFDLHLIGEGTHYRKYEKLGAHVREVENIRGVHFAVWAPNSRRVSIVGDFNHWDGRVHPMRSRGMTGIWELFIPGLDEGWIYKFEIRSDHGPLVQLKSDPYGFSSELRPHTGSRVADIERFVWHDDDWLARRELRNWLEAPVSVYEVHLGSWRRQYEGSRFLSYAEIAAQLLPYIQEMGYTHIELLPVMEHPFDGSWGYQTVGYFAVNSRHGGPADFMNFVDRFHEAGIGVILDWTPAHFPRDAHGLSWFDGTHLYEHADPRQGAHPDWGTLVFNYGRREVQNYLISNALFWIDKYHVDGLRVDAVASMLYLDYSRAAGEWVPNQYGGRENLEAVAFLKRLNEVVHGLHPGVLTIAEESTSWPAVSRPTYLGGLGFSLKWNMGWMHDTLNYLSQNPVFRKFHHNSITFSLLYAFSENFLLPLSHDEVVHGKGSLLNKMPGDLWQKFANLRLLYAYLFAHPGKKMVFMGAEIAQWREWNHDIGLDWSLLEHSSHRGILALLRDLNRLYSAEPALHQVDFDWRGFEWVDCHDADHSVLAFLRRGKDPGDSVLVVLNFTPVPRDAYRVGVPVPGFYRELLNTDSAAYDGTNVGNSGGVHSDDLPWMGRPHSLRLTLPPLGAVFFKL